MIMVTVYGDTVTKRWHFILSSNLYPTYRLVVYTSRSNYVLFWTTDTSADPEGRGGVGAAPLLKMVAPEMVGLSKILSAY